MTIERPMFPPRAESVQAFSLQPALPQPEIGNLPSESAKPAEGIGRRSILAALAFLPTALPVAAEAAAADPIHAAIKRHRALARVCDAAWKARGRCKDFGPQTEAEKAHILKLNDAVDEANLPLEAAAMNLFNTEPTTLAGLICALAYMRVQHRNEGVHMIEGCFEDEDGERYIDWRDAWLDTLTQAVMGQLDDAAVRS